eukprot:Sspe_Gene.62224::Locus_34818_Transcript_3_10_Confidence_0.355_Length_542::g.62224::m.62224
MLSPPPPHHDPLLCLTEREREREQEGKKQRKETKEKRNPQNKREEGGVGTSLSPQLSSLFQPIPSPLSISPKYPWPLSIPSDTSIPSSTTLSSFFFFFWG